MSKNKFNWVKARSECTTDKVFARLYEAVKKDLKNHQKRNPGISQGLKCKKCRENAFFVERHHSHRVIFENTNERITIERWSHKGKKTPLLKLSIDLNKEGDCILTDQNQDVWLLWQVRRAALEKTFFGGTP